MCLYAGACAVSGFFRGGEVGRNFSAEKKKEEGGNHVNIFVPGDISFESLGPSPVPVFSPGNGVSRVFKQIRKRTSHLMMTRSFPTRVSPKAKARAPAHAGYTDPVPGLKACAGPANKKILLRYTGVLLSPRYGQWFNSSDS